MKSVVIGAGSDLGVHIDGAKLGPIQLINDIKGFYNGEIVEFNQDPSIIKSRNISDRSKNRYEVNELNEKMYNEIVKRMKQGYFPIMIGGDHSAAIASALVCACFGITAFTFNSQLCSLNVNIRGRVISFASSVG